MIDYIKLIEVEDPAVEVLAEHLGWTELDTDYVDEMRSSLKEPVLIPIFAQALKRINPWISKENVQRVVRSVVDIQANSVMEANELIQAMLERNTTVPQDLADGLGLRSRDVFLIDHQNPENNEFHVVRQFQVHHRERCVLDIVLFINGLPVVVIECKSPALRDPMKEGKRELNLYQVAEGEFGDMGCPQLLRTVQIVVSTSKNRTLYAANFAPGSSWSEWKDPYPLTIDDVARELGRIPTPQDVFLFGVCSKENLLDLIRTFVVYEHDRGRVVKKLARYHQFRAANRIVKQVTTAHRGGLIWHWQGSGKSLTMLWTAVKLRLLLSNPTMVIVTDRTDLDDQVRGAFESGGLPHPIKARSAKHLQELLKCPVGQTVTATVQKFQDAAGKRKILSQDSNILVLVDEAHRSLYRSLGPKMRSALPNSIFLGFTGTPISRNDQDTILAFGDVIDIYDARQSVNDGVTVPIFYDERLPDLQVFGRSNDRILRKIFEDKRADELEKIEDVRGGLDAIGESKPLIREIALDIINHYGSTIMPNGFKAQVVASSRLAAVRYKEAFDELNGPSSEVLIALGAEDDDIYNPFRRSKSEEAVIIERFKHEKDPKILVVCDKYLAGFDAPAEQVIYLHKSLRSHSLLQAMGRVNRKAPKKEYGLVVDYLGVGGELEAALKIYRDEGIEGLVHTEYKKEILARLEKAHRAAMEFFVNAQAPKNKVYSEACIQYLEPEERRAAFDHWFKLLCRYMEILLPDPMALKYCPDLIKLAKIRAEARAVYNDDRLAFEDCGKKVMDLIVEHIQRSGTDRIAVPKEFDDKEEMRLSPEVNLCIIEKPIIHYLKVEPEERSQAYQSNRRRRDRVSEGYMQGGVDSSEPLRSLVELSNEVKSAEQRAPMMGVDPEVVAFYELFLAKFDDDQEALKKVSRDVYDTIRKLAVVDWQRKEDTKREMRRRIKRILLASNYPPDGVQDLTAEILDIAAKRFAG